MIELCCTAMCCVWIKVSSLYGSSKWFILVIWSPYQDVYQINIRSIITTSAYTYAHWPCVSMVIVIYLGHINDIEIIQNLWSEPYVWRVLCITPRWWSDACVMSSWHVRVICDMPPMSFHSSFYFKAVYMLAQRDEVWTSFLPLPHSDLSQSGRTTMSWQIFG